MKLNENTLAVLNNFANIQPNLLVEPGNNIRTVAEAMNIMAEATLDQEFPSKFVAYDLGEFLSMVNLLDDPELTFKADHVLMIGAGGRVKVKFYFASEEVITTVKKSVSMPEAEVSVTLDKATLDKVRQASGALGHEMVVIKDSGDGTVTVSVTDPNDSTSNEFTIEVPATYETGASFAFILNIKNLKVVPGDYEVLLSSKRLAKFTNVSVDLVYYIAMEKSSKYGE